MNKNYHKNIDSILPKVMLVEDEISIIEVLEIMFNDYGYSFEKCSDERKAVAKIKQFNPDIILQDIKMPNIPGCELIKDYRKFTDVPIIMVTAVSEKGKMKECLELGADDYLVKPYDIHDLLAKVNAQFRRYKNSRSYNEKTKVVNTLNLRINPVKRTIEDTGDDEWRVISLSAQDSSLFWHLWESKKIVSADEIAEKVFGWSNALNNRNAVIAAVKRLREKIEKDVHNPQIILSARGKGYYIGI